MSNAETIAELTDICIQQAEIIERQAYLIEQLGAEALEDETLAARLKALVGDWH